MTTLHIKNMVCDRCKLVVGQLLGGLDLPPTDVRLGEADVSREPTPEERSTLRTALKAVGFELLDDRRQQVLEAVKTAIIQLVRDESETLHRVTPSVYLSEKLGRDYKYLSTLFSETEGLTIEEFTIRQRLERVKELLEDGELSLTEIADRLHYSSVQYLSNQFKKGTGLTPGQYRQAGLPRQALDAVGK
ncbi:MAG: helix-turn-helix transcriptional regulator [Sphingobacteriaceae bacterium]|nr:helix-turn-helix transcriptional regulator [Cytophagaceae bacterium]